MNALRFLQLYYVLPIFTIEKRKAKEKSVFVANLSNKLNYFKVKNFSVKGNIILTIYILKVYPPHATLS